MEEGSFHVSERFSFMSGFLPKDKALINLKAYKRVKEESDAYYCKACDVILIERSSVEEY